MNVFIVICELCELGYEHTGKYTHLLSEDLQNKYMEMGFLKAYVDKTVPLN